MTELLLEVKVVARRILGVGGNSGALTRDLALEFSIAGEVLDGDILVRDRTGNVVVIRRETALLDRDCDGLVLGASLIR